MIRIPEELLEQVERGNVLLFIGERIVRDAEGRAVVDRLTAQLTTRCGFPDDESLTFPEAAQHYEDLTNSQALVQFIHDELAALGEEPQPVHDLIAELADCKVLATTCLDRRLERAIQNKRRLSVVIRNEDVAFADERAVQIYKLRGSVERPDSLLLTSDQYEVLEQQSTTSLVLLVLQGYLARKTILFLGYDLADPHFRRLYRKTIDPLDTYARRAYALFADPPSPKVSLWCERRGIQVLQIEVVEFLEALIAQQAVRLRPTPTEVSAPVVPLPQRPYKFLDYYEAGDTAIFFGRESETLELTSLIHAHRLMLLYGASGTGKTSLLLAGAVPRLEGADPPYETIYVRALEDPVSVIRRTVRRKLSQADLPQEDTLVDFLDAATRALDRTLVIILDQFEEFFIHLSPEFRAAFVGELGALYDAREVPVKVVLSLREDWLASVSEIEERIPEVFRTRMRLLPLTREQARQAIVEPVKMLEMGYEPSLVDRILDDLAGTRDTSVMPPQLQLVCDALYRHACDDGRQAITSSDYEAVGCAQAVLQQYLKNKLERMRSDEQALARAALGELVTSQGTKAVQAGEELALSLGVELPELTPVLEKLVRARLLRILEQEEGGSTYELAHEYLIAEIALSPEALARKEAKELLRREMESWWGLGKLIKPVALKLIHERRDDLRWLNTIVLELLFRSALAAVYEGATSKVAMYWFERASAGGVAADAIVLEGLKSDNFRTRAVAVAVLGQLGEQFASAIIEMLADDYPQVRTVAIHALERLRPDGEWRKHLKYECYVPAGEFIMGDGGKDFSGEKVPAHKVYLDAFYIAKYPVTNADYKRYIDDCERSRGISGGKSNHPVANISWYDARDYAAWAEMRLLTEAEWEKAASWEEEGRSGLLEPGKKQSRKCQYPWGNQFHQGKCNTAESGISSTTPVGKYSPYGDSPYGCADMAGNVWEWTSSIYKNYPYQADDRQEDLHLSDFRVLRGGSFVNVEVSARSAYRLKSFPNFRSRKRGCRVCMTAPCSPHSGSTDALSEDEATEQEMPQ